MARHSTDPETERLADALAPASTVPLSVRLRGALEFGIASGEWPAGTRLPSVRALARRLGMSPVTVSAVYAALREAGHVEGRAGSGTFVRRDAPVPDAARLRDLDARVAGLLAAGRALGLGPADLALRVSMAPAARPRGLRILMVGNFHDATEAYAGDLRAVLPEGDRVGVATMSDLRADRAPAARADVVLAPRTLLPDLRALAPGVPSLGVTLIPNQATRVALATLPPDAAVVGYSYFPAFVTTMRGGIARFAPHVADLTMAVRGQPGAAGIVAGADVLIYATGAEALRAGLRPDQAAFEYRHAPDGRSLRDEVLPALDAHRAAPARREEAAA